MNIILICDIKLVESKTYHDRVAKHVSWTKVAKTCVDGFENLGDREKDAKSKKLFIYIL